LITAGGVSGGSIRAVPRTSNGDGSSAGNDTITVGSSHAETTMIQHPTP